MPDNAMVKVWVDIPESIPWNQDRLVELSKRVQERSLEELFNRHGDHWLSHVQPGLVKQPPKMFWVLTAAANLSEDITDTFRRQFAFQVSLMSLEYREPDPAE